MGKIRNILQDKELMMNLFKYLVIGGLAAGLDFLVFIVLLDNAGVYELIANIISMHVGMLVSFSLNSIFNFRKKDRVFRRFLCYYLIILMGIGLSSLMIWGGSMIMSEKVIKLISMGIVAGIQFVLNRLFTFKTYDKFAEAK